MGYRIRIRRLLEVPPVSDPQRRERLLAIIEDNANDWTHFTHVHHRHIAGYDLLYKHGSREIFLYKSRRLWPLPWFDHFIVFRDYRPQQRGYRNVYLHVKSGAMNFLESSCEETQEGGIRLTGDFLFDLPFYWRFMPGIFLWIFKKRMRTLMDEDNDVIDERMRMKGFENRACRPLVPDSYDLYLDRFGENPMPAADIELLDQSRYPGWEKLP